ncbi:MAG: 4Fe-4S dicluster domain-containing protein [Lachnospira sp.]
MLSNDATILKIKHEVLYQVAKAAYAGNLEERKESIPYELIPGPQAKFRCCVYKEREIVRQRIRLAEGKCPQGEDKPGSDNVIQVIEAACADCPLSHYIVTDNCRKCMAKACKQACKFGAVSMGRDRAYIDPEKCKECGQCAKACPYNAIADLIRPCKKTCPVDAITMDDNGICQIDVEKCIACGKCIHACPFGAIGSKTDIVSIINDIRGGKSVIAMVAPSVEGSFGNNISMDSFRTACKKLGFEDMIEVGLGGDMTAGAEAKEWLEANKEGKKMTTSCCPAFVNMIRKHYPELVDNMSTTVSPMFAVSRMLKSKNPDVKTVFIGPCIAKKSEKQDKSNEGNADYVITVGEFRAMLRAKNVDIEPEEIKTQQASIYGKRFGNGGGVTAAVLRCMEELGEDPSKYTVEKCAGAAECKKALTLLKVGKLPADFIEGMMCEGGCVGGPSRFMSGKNDALVAKDRDTLLNQADDRGVYENLGNYDMDAFSMHKEV